MYAKVMVSKPSPVGRAPQCIKVFVDGDEAVVIYDVVTDTAVVAVLSVEHVKVRAGRIVSSVLVFEKLDRPEVQAALATRAAREPAGAAA